MWWMFDKCSFITPYNKMLWNRTHNTKGTFPIAKNILNNISTYNLEHIFTKAQALFSALKSKALPHWENTESWVCLGKKIIYSVDNVLNIN